MMETSKEKTEELTVIINSDLKTPTSIVSLASFEYPPANRLTSDQAIDTIRLNIREIDLIRLQNNNIYTDSIIVRQGDTLLLTVQQNKFIKKIKNGKEKDIETWSINAVLKEDKGMKKVDSLTSLFYSIGYSYPTVVYNDYATELLYPQIPNPENIEHKTEELLLLKEEYLDLFEKYEKENRSLYKQEKALLLNDLFRYRMFYDLFTLYRFSNNPEIAETLTSDLFISDSTLIYPNGKSYLRTAIKGIYFKDLMDKSRSKIHYDLPQIYDSIPRFFSENLSRYARIICLEEMMIQGNSLDEVSAYFNKFKDEYGKTSFTKYYQDTYLLDLKEMYNSGTSLNLIDGPGTVIDLEALLHSLKGNVVYIDYWASWCAPCRKAMPSSRELLKDYKEDNVVFVYLSIDKNKKAWRDASSIEGLDAYKYNFLVLNHNQSDFTRKLEINAIPRYLLYDKNGELVHQNAPGPESEEIKQLFDEHLQERSEIQKIRD